MMGTCGEGRRSHAEIGSESFRRGVGLASDNPLLGEYTQTRKYLCSKNSIPS